MVDVRRLPAGEDNEIAVTLDDLAREGARRMIATALKAEADEYVASFVGELDEDGKRLVVRNGRARERKVTIGSGTVAIRAPRVNDEENCRQIASRARRAVDERRPRFDPPDEERRRVAERFFAALAGDVSDIAAVLTEDVVMHGDGGGKVPSIARPLVGADRVSRAWANWAKLGLRLAARIEMTLVHGQPGALLKTADGALLTVVSLDIVEGRVREIRNILNPDKLDHLGRVADANELLRASRGG